MDIETKRNMINDMYSNSTEFTNVVSDAGFNDEVLVRMKLSLDVLIPQQNGIWMFASVYLRKTDDAMYARLWTL